MCLLIAFGCIACLSHLVTQHHSSKGSRYRRSVLLVGSECDSSEKASSIHVEPLLSLVTSNPPQLPCFLFSLFWSRWNLKWPYNKDGDVFTYSCQSHFIAKHRRKSKYSQQRVESRVKLYNQLAVWLFDVFVHGHVNLGISSSCQTINLCGRVSPGSPIPPTSYE